MLQIGSLVDNKYKILSEVGRGGMSVVYLAINERANKTWAVKEVRKDGVCDFEAVKQGLIVETDMLKKLSHEHLPSIIDVIDNDDSFLIVMDYIEGKSLQKVLKNAGAQPQSRVIKWGIQLCDVLGYLHSQNPPIIYRDMKPANVMLKPNGNITLIDFGTAREFKDRAMVEDTTCLGTRGYAAPEQFGGRGQTDPRTDVYCLGATLYHLLTGHSPAEPPYEIKPLRYWDPNLAGSGMEKIIFKCCQQDPAQRYQSCEELKWDLEHVIELGEAEVRTRRRKWNAFVASVALCLVGVAGMIGFGIAKNSSTKDVYNRFLDDAKTSSGDFAVFSDHIRQAMEVDPRNEAAYDLLLDQIEKDGNLDDTEWSILRGLLKDYDSALLSEDRESYAQVQFRTGKLLFLNTDGSDMYLDDSVPYFEHALNEGRMAQKTDEQGIKDAQLATALKTIGESRDKLNSAASVFTGSDYTYPEFWDDLKELVASNTFSVSDERDVKACTLAVYRRVLALMIENYKGFLDAGIPAEEMEQLLNTVDQALTEIEANSTSDNALMSLANGTRGNLTNIRRQLDAMVEKGGNS